MRYVIGIILLCCASGAAAQPSIRFTAVEPVAVAAGDEAGPQAFVLADVDQDEILDLAVINSDDDEVWVLRGNGDGTFAAATVYGLEGRPTSVTVADVSSPFASEQAGDIDGKPDLIVAHEDGFAEVLLGRGDGQFDPPEQDLSEVLDSAELLGIVVGDFDGDERNDLAFLDFFDEVYFLCNLNGSLAPCFNDVLETGGSEAVTIAGGDFDGDTNFDVAALSADSADVSIMYGNGDGSFDEVVSTLPATGEAEQVPRAMLAARLDGDASDDLVIANHTTFTDLSLVTYPGRPNRMPAQRSFVGLFSMSALALGQFDAGATVDAVMIVDAGLAGVSFGDGSGGFLTPVQILGDPVRSGRAAAAADLDGDGRDDLVVLGSDGLQIQAYLNEVEECAGDCDAGGTVTIDELIRGVSIALGAQAADTCRALDSDGSDSVEINELIAAVARALEGCTA